jgi:hypothetical protein
MTPNAWFAELLRVIAPPLVDRRAAATIGSLPR